MPYICRICRLGLQSVSHVVQTPPFVLSIVFSIQLNNLPHQSPPPPIEPTCLHFLFSPPYYLSTSLCKFFSVPLRHILPPSLQLRTRKLYTVLSYCHFSNWCGCRGKGLTPTFWASLLSSLLYMNIEHHLTPMHIQSPQPYTFLGGCTPFDNMG